jgi:hypothetical protein
MTELSPNARGLIDTVGAADGPSARDRERIRASLFGAIAAGTTVAASTQAALGAPAGVGLAKAAVNGEIAVGTGLAVLTGKGTMAVALWFIAGGAAGTAVAAPVALFTERSEPALVAPALHAGDRTVSPAVAIARPTRIAAGEAPRTGAAEPALATEPPRAPREKVVLRSADESAVAVKDRSEPERELGSATHSPSAPSLATEVRLLKSAQRELSAANASASLALLDEHARLYPDGALKAERLGARVFALCKLGHVEQARKAAREFLRVAGSSPLVPRVLSSCAGTLPPSEKRR